MFIGILMMQGLALTASGQSNFPLTFSESVYDGQLYRTFSFDTDEFMTYRIQTSQDAENWSNLLIFEGFNDSITFPFAELLQGGQASQTPSKYPETPIVLTLERATGGGAVMAWRSLVDQQVKKYYVAGITLKSQWDRAPLFNVTTDKYNYFIMSPS